jgi:hypothetical protein
MVPGDAIFVIWRTKGRSPYMMVTGSRCEEWCSIPKCHSVLAIPGSPGREPSALSEEARVRLSAAGWSKDEKGRYRCPEHELRTNR